MGGEHIPKGCLAFKYSAGFTQFRLGVQRGEFDTKLFNLLVSDPAHGAAGYQLVAIEIAEVGEVAEGAARAGPPRMLTLRVGGS